MPELVGTLKAEIDGQQHQPDVYFCERGILKKRRFELDNKQYACRLGAWAFYIPELQIKVFHSVEAKTHCTHKSAPDRRELLARGTGLKNERYSVQEWVSALDKPVLKRAAENYVAAKRLHRAGLGPDAHGFVVIRRYSAPYTHGGDYNIGLFVDNLEHYPPKQEATHEELIRAGVIPDKIESCLRQQIKGYVSDLNSVVGVMPSDAQQQIEQVHRELSLNVEHLAQRAPEGNPRKGPNLFSNLIAKLKR